MRQLLVKKKFTKATFKTLLLARNTSTFIVDA